MLFCFYKCVASCEWVTRKEVLSSMSPSREGRVVGCGIAYMGKKKACSKTAIRAYKKKSSIR